MNEKQFEMTADTLQTKIYDQRLIRKLIRYLKPYKLLVALSFFLLILITLTELTLPLIIKTAVDEHIVPSRSLIVFENRDNFTDFIEQNNQSKFTGYSNGERHYVVFPTDNKNYFSREELSGLEESGQYTEINYIVIENTSENREILSETDHFVLSDEEIAISQTNLESLGREQISILRTESRNKLYYFGLVFLLLIVFRLILNYFQVYVTHYAAQRAMYTLREEAFAHLEKMPLSFFDKNPVGRLVTRVTTDIRALDELLTQGLIQMLQDFLVLIGIVIIMLILNWRLALVSYIIVPFVLILIRYFNKKTRVIYREVRKRVAMLNASLAEDISGIKIIQLFDQFSNKCKQFGRINQGYYDASMQQLRLFAFFRPLIGISRHIAVAIVLWYGGGQILRNALSLGMLMAFIRYMERFFEPINQISEKFNVLQAAMSGAERVFDLMERDPQDYREELTANAVLEGEIEFKNVWLTYNEDQDGKQAGSLTLKEGNDFSENPPDIEQDVQIQLKETSNEQDGFVLRDINFKIREGEKIALVGHTGSGKTSIINLISGMYPFQKGDILIDRKSIKEYSLHDIRNNIGIVQQDVFLFSGTIKENIVLNNHNISDEEIERIGRYVNVDRFIDQLQGRYDEPVMERGATFSVGQRQLIAFARVLAYNPSIFILDEATSNIDTETELLIQDALLKVMKDRTSIVIAHRLSTIQNVDRIIVLHKGRIVEEGHHNELIANKNLYYDLYRLQYS